MFTHSELGTGQKVIALKLKIREGLIKLNGTLRLEWSQLLLLCADRSTCCRLLGNFGATSLTGFACSVMFVVDCYIRVTCGRG